MTSASSHKFIFDYGKYRGILISVALFILLDASVMALNFYVSFEISEDAISINMAGRQRMLSQRMAKSLYALNSEVPGSTLFNHSAAELNNSKALFDETLTAFSEGGTTQSTNKELIILPEAKSIQAKKILNATFTIWQGYKSSIDKLLSDIEHDANNGANLDDALAQTKMYNLELLGLMNDLTTNLEQVAASKANRLRIIQTVGFSLAILNFLFIMLHFLRQLRESDKVLESARSETMEILQTVNDGLFLLNKKLIIGAQYSTNLMTILGTKNIAGQSFKQLLDGMITEKDADTTRGFIELLFDKKIKEKLIGSLNPLNLVEVNIAQVSGGFLTKYLQFNFARAYQDSNISHVLVTVSDVSEKIRLEKALIDSRKHNDSQIEMLTSLLHTHPSLLKEFISNSYACYNRMNNILRKPAKDNATVRQKVTDIFREIHNFKGEASSLKLEHFENQAHNIENTLSELREKTDLSGNDYLGLAVQLEELISYTQRIELLTKKLSIFGQYQPTMPTPFMDTNDNSTTTRLQDSWSHLPEFVQNIAQRNGKLVKLVTSGLNDIDLPAAYCQQIKDICIQLLRNAVTHGIETPTDRELSEKPLVGRIDLRMAKISDSEMEITVMDDGTGLDYNAIRAQAVSSNRWDEDEIDSWGNKHLLALIFHEGFSTAKEITTDAGRGVGMEMVMNHVLQHRGKIMVSTRRGRHCRFVITLPIVSDATTTPTDTEEENYAAAYDC